MGKRQRQVIDFFWNGREGILPWFCFYDDKKQVIYPLIFSSQNPLITYTLSDPNWLGILQVEDIAQNCIFLVAKPNGLGQLYDAFGHSYGNWDVKRFVVIRNQFDKDPYLLVLRKVNKDGNNFAYELFGGSITDLTNPFAKLTRFSKIHDTENLNFFDIAKFQNRVLFLNINTKGQTVLWWSKINVQWSQTNAGSDNLNFFQPVHALNEFQYITFPEYFVVLPPSNFHFIWENFLTMSDGVYELYPTEISGTFSLVFEKIFSLTIPNEYGGGTGVDDIRAGFQYFKNGFAVSLRGNTYVFGLGKKIEILEQTGVDTYISPNAPLNIRRLGFKHSVSPYLAYPENWRFFKNDNYIIFSDWNQDTKQLKIYIFQIAEQGFRFPNSCYIISTAGTPFEIKYLRRIAPLRFYEIYIQTSDTINFTIPPAPFITTNLIITQHEYPNVEQKWIQTRDAGNTFIVEFEVPQTIQAQFEFEYDTGR
ncbi:MAG: hypothetical protein ABIM44_05720 [candidate division WOR-3 bacterium]